MFSFGALSFIHRSTEGWVQNNVQPSKGGGGGRKVLDLLCLEKRGVNVLEPQLIFPFGSPRPLPLISIDLCLCLCHLDILKCNYYYFLKILKILGNQILTLGYHITGTDCPVENQVQNRV